MIKRIAWWLVIIGALNWGLVAIGYFVNRSNWNVVDVIFNGGFIAHLVYLLVGISAVYVLMGHCGCKGCGGMCKACDSGKCDKHGTGNRPM